MTEDPDKVQKITDYLNRNYKASKPWVAIADFHALTKFEYGISDKGPTFYPSSGIPMKAFINIKTGEIKLYSGRIFLKN
jgi:hypothetical protein